MKAAALKTKDALKSNTETTLAASRQMVLDRDYHSFSYCTVVAKVAGELH